MEWYSPFKLTFVVMLAFDPRSDEAAVAYSLN